MQHGYSEGELGQTIYDARRAASLTQSDLAEILDTRQQTITNWENGQRPDESRWPALADWLNIPLDEVERLAGPPRRMRPRQRHLTVAPMPAPSTSSSGTRPPGELEEGFTRLFLRRWEEKSMPDEVIARVARFLFPDE